MKKLSCGIIIISSKNEILGCHPFGRTETRLDLPKGGINIGESEIDAAIRETYEETGIRVPKEELLDLGRHEYTKEKDLYLFSCKCDIADVSELTCSTYFDVKGRLVPEMIGYEWVKIENIEDRFFKPIVKVIKNIHELY